MVGDLLHWFTGPYLKDTQASFRWKRWNTTWLYIYPLGAFLHLTFIPLFALLGVPVLAWVNVGSTLAWIIGTFVYRGGRPRLAGRIAFVEIVVHAAACVHQIGWEAGLQHAMSLLALGLASPWLSRAERVIQVSIVIGATVVCRSFGPPAVQLNHTVVLVMSGTFAVLLFVVFVFMFLMMNGTADRLEAELARERAKTEQLLKQEVKHQVAERSRELGSVLAATEGPVGTTPLTPGERFAARYKVVRTLGAGGMGAVYEVERLTDGQRLALKVVPREVTGTAAARFAREAEIGARVHHENLVSIVDVGVSPQGAVFLAMELVDGGSLEECRARFGQAAWAVPILRQVAAGVAALHGAGVVHRDLKPGNVLLSGSADAPTARISDFGISRFGAIDDSVNPNAATIDVAKAATAAGLTGTNALLGTPLYMAPEAARGGREVDTPADVFAFGILAYELLTGSSPFAMPPVLLAMAGQPIIAPAAIDGEISEAVRSIVLRCLEVDSKARPRIQDVITAFGV